MRVLDVGCGAGDVSMLAAELVGSTGSVIGIDRNEQVLAIARERTQMAKFGQIDFKEAATGTYSDPEPFDLVVGRYVLIHQPDPVDLIPSRLLQPAEIPVQTRAAAALSRPGGIVAFHELNLPPGVRSFPDVPLWQQVGERIATAFKSAAPHWDAGARMTEQFSTKEALEVPRESLVLQSMSAGERRFMKTDAISTASLELSTDAADLAERVRVNQAKLTSELRSHYDFIVCGSGSSGSVVARRLAENPGVSVLLLEAGGSDDVPSVMEAGQWPANLGSARDWDFQAKPNPHLNGRSISMNMGKVPGCGSSINVMAWSRGHKNDWDYFASEAGDPGWNYESVLKIYRRIEDWHGAPDPKYRGTGGPVFVQPAPDPNPIAPAMLEGARSVGIPTFENQNGRMMEGAGGSSILDLRIRNGKRQSVFRSYTFPYMDRPNLTVLTHALVTRITFEGKRATGVECIYNGNTHRLSAGLEVVLSLGAIHTPKVLMQSGIGDEVELQTHRIPLVQHLSGVGMNFQDHPGIGCIWEYQQPLAPRHITGVATFFWKSDPSLETPDIQTIQAEIPFAGAEMLARYNVPAGSWSMFAGVVRPKSRGRIRLTGPNPFDPLQIEPDQLFHSDDLKAAIACVQLCREIGNSDALRPFVKREVMPGNLKGAALENFIRDSVVTYWHQTCTAKMGRDAISVVDANLKVYGIDNLRIADGSVMPRVTTGNTMAPCVIIGERAGEILKADHKL